MALSSATFPASTLNHPLCRRALEQITFFICLAQFGLHGADAVVAHLFSLAVLQFAQGTFGLRCENERHVFSHPRTQNSMGKLSHCFHSRQ